MDIFWEGVIFFLGRFFWEGEPPLAAVFRDIEEKWYFWGSERKKKGRREELRVFSRIFAGEELFRCVLCGFFSSSVHVFHYIFTFMHSPCCLSFHSPFECDCYAIFSFSVISLEAITYMGSYASCYPAFFFLPYMLF